MSDFESPAFCPICGRPGGSIQPKSTGAAEVMPCEDCLADRDVLAGGLLFGTWRTALREYGLNHAEPPAL